MGAVVLGTLIAGPAIAGAYAGVQTANAATEEANAYRAASTALAQDPLKTQQEVASSAGVPAIGATGEIQLPENLRAWLPLLLLFVVVMYVIFKD